MTRFASFSFPSRWCGGLFRLIRRVLWASAPAALLSAACLPGVDYDKVDSGSGGSGTGAGGSGGAGGACVATPGSCSAGTILPLIGTGDVEVTDIARVSGSQHVLVVGRVSGSFSVSGVQIAAGSSQTDGFLLQIDGNGSYVGHLMLPEMDETSQLYVGYEPNQGEVVVGGNFSQGPAGECPTARGLSMRRLLRSGTSYDSLFENNIQVVCIAAGANTTLTVHDVGVYPTPAWGQIMGSFEGLLGGEMSTGVDGFAVSVSPEGVASPPFVVGGTGDAAVRGGMPSYPNNEWVLVGDFSGEMSFDIPNTPGASETAVGGRDLFVMAFDTAAGMENLSFITMGLPQGDHRVVGLSYPVDVLETDSAVMLVQLDGPLLVQNPTITLNGEGGAATLAMPFRAPSESASTTFQMLDYYLLHADLIEPVAIGGNADVFSLIGHAIGDIAIEQGGSSIGLIEAAGCQRDAFTVTLQGGTLVQQQRCGDGQQQLSAISARDVGSAAAITVPVGASLDTGQGEQRVDNGSDSFLLLQ